MIKRLLKWTGLVLLLLVALTGGVVTHEWVADKPWFFRAYLDRTPIRVAFARPETLTSLGFLESLGIHGHNARLNDAHPDRITELFETLREYRDGLDQYPDDSLDDQQRMSKAVAQYLLDILVAAEPYRYHYYPANQMFGIQSAFPSFMHSQHQVRSREDAEHYLARMAQLERKFRQQLLDLQIRQQRGIIPPRFVIERVLKQMQDFVDTPTEDNILYASLAEKLDALDDLERDERDRLLGRAHELIDTAVYPAYGLLIDYFTALLPSAGTDDGYWRLPDGEKVYALALKLFTTTDYTADEIHQLGLAEVDRIQTEMMQLFESLGLDTSKGFIAASTQFTDNPAFYYQDSDAGRAQILEDYQTILDEIDAGLGSAFNIRPKAGMEVVRVPEFQEQTAPGAYYQPPSLDGSRPGRFFANLYDIRATPRFGMRTLAYHEGIPGHHFQVAIAMELAGMPLIRRFGLFSAYSEGWALYAEQLAFELGFQQRTEDNIGRLVAELFRAVRLVVDTGIHHKRWTREQAIDYMRMNTGMADSDVVSEIERYIVMPGQATSYKVGMIKILELRQKARDALGDRFDLARFHDAVLKNGPLPLHLLEQIIDEYIAEELESASR